MGTDLTRREALRRGTLLGTGAIWAAPAVRSLTMSSNFAAATSPVVAGEEIEATTSTTIPTEVEGIVVSGGQLPFTGVEARNAAVLGAGLLAAGATIVHATKKDRPVGDQPESE